MDAKPVIATGFPRKRGRADAKASGTKSAPLGAMAAGPKRAGAIVRLQRVFRRFLAGAAPAQQGLGQRGAGGLGLRRGQPGLGRLLLKTPQVSAAGSVSSRPLNSGQLANSSATQSAKARTLGESWRLCG